MLFVITLITSVPHISLNRFYMCFKNSFPFCLVITLIRCTVQSCLFNKLLVPNFRSQWSHLNSVSCRIIFTCLYSYCTFDNLLSHSAHYNVDFCKESKAIIQINPIPSTYRKSFPGKVCPIFSGIKILRFILPVICVQSHLLYLVMWKSIEDLTALKRNHFLVTSVPSYSFKAVPFNTHKNLMVEGSICEMSAYTV